MLLVRCVYCLSYPFLIEGDGETYYRLLLESQAHLLHATGYIFFSLPVRLLANLIGTAPANLLLFFQQGLSAGAVAVLYLALKRLVPRWISFLTCLLLGIDAQLVAAAGTTRPEFFQASILMLLISAAIFGLTSVSRPRKAVFYFGTGVLAAAGYLTKYNFLPSAVFCFVPLFDGGLPWNSRWRMLGRSGLGATLLLVLFVTSFHYPTTGSFRLNLEHGWIHILKLEKAEIPILPTNGIATQKYIVLSESLPQRAAGPDQWKKIDQVPEAIRAPFREKWSVLLATQDATYAKAAFDALSASESRRKSYYDPAALSPIYYYLGLREGERLLRDVYWEGLRGHSRKYLTNVWSELLHGANFSANYEPYLPVPGVYEPGDFFKLSGMPHPAAPPRVFKAVDWSIATPQDLAALAAQVWQPGARFLSCFAFLKYIPAGLLWIVMLAAFSLVPIFFARHRRLRPVEVLLMLAAVALLGEMTFSAALFVFRNKELILCQPLVYLMIGLSVSLWVEFASTSQPRLSDH